MREFDKLLDLADLVGQEIGVSEWLLVAVQEVPKCPIAEGAGIIGRESDRCLPGAPSGAMPRIGYHRSVNKQGLRRDNSQAVRRG